MPQGMNEAQKWMAQIDELVCVSLPLDPAEELERALEARLHVADLGVHAVQSRVTPESFNEKVADIARHTRELFEAGSVGGEPLNNYGISVRHIEAEELWPGHEKYRGERVYLMRIEGNPAYCYDCSLARGMEVPAAVREARRDRVEEQERMREELTPTEKVEFEAWAAQAARAAGRGMAEVSIIDEVGFKQEYPPTLGDICERG